MFENDSREIKCTRKSNFEQMISFFLSKLGTLSLLYLLSKRKLNEMNETNITKNHNNCFFLQEFYTDTSFDNDNPSNVRISLRKGNRNEIK